MRQPRRAHHSFAARSRSSRRPSRVRSESYRKAPSARTLRWLPILPGGRTSRPRLRAFGPSVLRFAEIAGVARTVRFGVGVDLIGQSLFRVDTLIEGLGVARILFLCRLLL